MEQTLLPLLSPIRQPLFPSNTGVSLGSRNMDPTLEGLPGELKILVLFQVPDFDALKSLVLASPGYHQAYLTVRLKLLKGLVKWQYSGFLDLAEALTVLRSESVYFSRGVEDTVCLLDLWRRRSEIDQSSFKESNSLDENIKLLHFHKALHFFLEDYSIHAPRPPWIQPNDWERYLPLRLSSHEKHRFLRALCRLQIVQNIFGDPVYCLKYPSCDSCGGREPWNLETTEELKKLQGTHDPWFIDEQAYRLFYGAMPPWEHEEMGSVLRYLAKKIETIFTEEIADDLRRLSKSTPCHFFWDILPKEQRPPSGCEIESEFDLVHFPKHFEGLAGLGPNFIYRVLHMDRLSRRNTVCVNTRGAWGGPWIGLQIRLSWDFKFPFTDLAASHERPNFEQFWSTLMPTEQPTMAWKRAWLLPHNEQDTLEDALNYERNPEMDWDWGYALWDEGRLQEWKAPLLDDAQQMYRRNS